MNKLKTKEIGWYDFEEEFSNENDEFFENIFSKNSSLIIIGQSQALSIELYPCLMKKFSDIDLYFEGLKIEDYAFNNDDNDIVIIFRVKDKSEKIKKCIYEVLEYFSVTTLIPLDNEYQNISSMLNYHRENFGARNKGHNWNRYGIKSFFTYFEGCLSKTYWE
ncbi:hypothetical protein [Aureibacter tunicatorum]|uniref:Uncharacterized protein n=1 Tax=Aureibacter tunicatorum TaxID=866807 RepID=A0AAE3XNQ3_9BACT|nr:hypothetical protein [Aureibacter tunicatorum]MDR6239318.1 hypothetical protein [Aureibacter tunicatorum]BDD04758.1 hypothetical protein AUTU_22410 [Aureibacter tunicatorum]